MSRRTTWQTAPNRLTQALGRRRALGLHSHDLTQSNPTHCGLSPQLSVLRDAFADDRVAIYQPHPLGHPEARQAVAALLGTGIDADHIALTAATSEAYSFLFKLLCDSGDNVLVPTPCYPLFGDLAGLEGVTTRNYPVFYAGGEWQIDLDALTMAADPRTRAVIVVAPANPTGGVLTAAELRAIEGFCVDRGLALICDEVFVQTAGIFGTWPRSATRSVAGRSNCLTFALGGLSKTCLLPQLKCAWLVCSGPQPQLADVMARLELIADTFLSVATPVQLALPALLGLTATIQAQLCQRLTSNRVVLDHLLRDTFMQLLPSCGGWSAVLRLPDGLDDEAVAVQLLDRAGVWLHPGYFYDFADGGHLVVSLLPRPGEFTAAVRALVDDSPRWPAEAP